MFERFTTQARAVIDDAQRCARELGHHYVGTEHLLMALLERPAGIPSAVLGDAGLTTERVRSDIEAYLSDARGRENTVLDREDAEALEAIGRASCRERV